MTTVRFLETEEYPAWDRFVDQTDQGSIFSKSWWLALTTKDQFKICVVEGDGEIFAGLPLPYFSTGNVRMGRLSQSGGLLFKEKKDAKLQKKLTNQKEHTNLIFEFIRDRMKSFDINFHYNYGFWSPLFWLGFKQTTKYTYVIDYDQFDAADQFVNLSKGHKWVVNKAARNEDLSITEISDLDLFYREAKKTYARKDITIGYSFEELARLDAALKEHDARKIFAVVDRENNVHAVNYYIYDGNEVYYWLGASDEQHRNSGAHTFLIWHAIKYFSDKTKRFNFGGSMMEDVDKNFRNFGATPAPYYRIYKLGALGTALDVLKESMPREIKGRIKRNLAFWKRQ
jgi:hypothetical protein